MFWVYLFICVVYKVVLLIVPTFALIFFFIFIFWLGRFSSSDALVRRREGTLADLKLPLWAGPPPPPRPPSAIKFCLNAQRTIVGLYNKERPTRMKKEKKTRWQTVIKHSNRTGVVGIEQKKRRPAVLGGQDHP